MFLGSTLFIIFISRVQKRGILFLSTYVKGVPFFNKRYVKGLAFYQNDVQMGNKGIEPPTELSRLLPPQAGGGRGWNSGKTCSPCVDSSADEIHICFSSYNSLTRLYPISNISRFNQTLMLRDPKVRRQALLQLPWLNWVQTCTSYGVTRAT